MPTPEIPDDELEILFRQGFERFPEERSLAEWWRLQEKFQAQALKQQVRRRVRQVLAAEVLLLSLGALLWLAWPAATRLVWQHAPLATGTASPDPGGYPPATGALPNRPRHPVPGILAIPAQPSASASSPGTPQPPAQPSIAAAVASPAVVGPRPGSAHLQPWEGRRVPAALRAAHLLVLPGTSHRAAWASRSPQSESGRAQSVAIRPRRARLGNEPARAHQLTAAPPLTNPDAGPANETGLALNGSAPVSRLTANEFLAGVVTQVAQPAGAPLPAPLAGLVVAPDDPVPPATLPYRLSITLVGATQLSAVRFARLMPPGQSIGLKVEYQFTPRLGVSTGVVRTHQIFDADGADYNMPASPGTTLMWVSGIAQVLDVPLNLRYNLLARSRYGLYASAGLSSVLVRGERYRYDFLVNGQLKQDDAARANGSQHLFSNLNLSVGYERPLGQGRWAAQVEPFVKLPLSGIGAGQVMVGSAGLQLGLKYGLLPATGRP